MADTVIIDSVMYDYDFPPEQNLWVHVLIKFLEDIDKVVHYVYERLLPKRRALEKEMLNHIGTPRADEINLELIKVNEALTRCLRELDELLYEVNHQWTRDMCSFIDFSYKRFKEIADGIVTGKVTIKERKSFLAFKGSVENYADVPIPNLNKNLPSRN